MLSLPAFVHQFALLQHSFIYHCIAIDLLSFCFVPLELSWYSLILSFLGTIVRKTSDVRHRFSFSHIRHKLPSVAFSDARRSSMIIQSAAIIQWSPLTAEAHIETR